MTTQLLAANPAALARRHVAALAAHRWVALPVVLAGTFMVVLDFFIVNVALPSMEHGLHAHGDRLLADIGAGA